MTAPSEPSPPQADRRVSLRSRVSDDLAYILPFFAFILLTSLAGQFPDAYPVFYAIKAVVAAGLLVWLWPLFTKIKWDYWWLGVIAGVIGIFQWVPMQLWLQANFAFFRPPPPDTVFNPYQKIQPDWLCWAWIAVRILSASLVVPLMEELFWRDYLWRRIIAPNDFKLATVGEWDWRAYVGVSLAFAVVHGNWWLTSIVWGFMVGGLLLYTRSLGACIVMHATTNALLAAYVLYYQDWAFW
ncbi:CAAX prenyl protease-related protein [Humisphaera borealis]|uniref:CAAX prenyl protease-related protein n=1 Tax=Humisphaera borealis TaxID=2807512 RepID=A0A7M2X312_9BACT|nr:CAAX prenyl protease-related protein [Humisphaera borealis]QOV92148.1 CAAX prenyl protease-related protein [Humisphaera borealis]